MSLRFTGKALLATTFLSASLLAFAGEEQVLCPPASFIKNLWVDINTVSVYYGSSGENLFFTSAEDSAFDQGSNLWWYVHSITKGKDFNSAFMMGQHNVKNVYQVRNKYAQKDTDRYFCSYENNDRSMSVYIFGYKNRYQGSRKDMK